ncbi:DUF4233 domain-containing protein [Agromyces archimandritae]|nr:DUF4233 domain-containing protein [Agromyces archimandritae]
MNGRSAVASLGAIVLVFEMLVVFLAALVIWGLAPAPFGDGGIPSWVALAGGGVFLVLMVVTMRLLPRSSAIILGWVLQGLLVLAGFLNPALFVVGALFGGMWWYCMVTGARLDRQSAEARAAEAAEAADRPSADDTPADDAPGDDAPGRPAD